MSIQLNNNFLVLVNFVLDYIASFILGFIASLVASLVAGLIASHIIGFAFGTIADQFIFVVIDLNMLFYYEIAVIAKHFTSLKLYIKKII